MKKESKILKNKKIIITIASVIAAVILLIVGVIVLSKTLAKESMEQKLEKIGKDFYENWYYDLSGKDDKERKEKLAKFNTLGLKISLDNLSRIKTYTKENLTKEEKEVKDKEHEELFASFVEEKTKNPCDKDRTMVTIYPVSPYGKKDYKIEVKLVCEPKEEVTTIEENKEEKTDDKKTEEEKIKSEKTEKK